MQPTPAVTIKETPSDGAGRRSVTATTEIEADVDSDGKAVVTVEEYRITQAISKAAEEAAKGEEGSEAKLEIKINTPSGANSFDINITENSFKKISESEAAELTISTPMADITFSGEALDGISGESSGNIRISVSKVETLPDEVKDIVGDRPVYDFSVRSGDKAITEFGGRVTVSIPYTPKDGEDINSIVIYYINSDGELEIISNCKFDPVSGMVSFTTDHFSQYAVGYNKVSFTDVDSTAWYSKAVDFIAARGITIGTGNGKFSPDGFMTRGQFIVMMLRAYGIKPDENPTDNFDDAGNTYYTGYLAAAKRLGISNGIGNNMFGPDLKITRQEMYTLLYNTLNKVGMLLSDETGHDLTDYTDADQISPWARNAVKALVKAGIISSEDSRIMPVEIASRALMAQTMYNLLSK